jgi:hypothetical protein
MIEKLIDMADNIIQHSRNSYSVNCKYKNNHWKNCVILAKLGWKAYHFKYLPTDTDDDVIIKWRKEGKDDIKIRLSFTEQCLWLKYMESENEKSK